MFRHVLNNLRLEGVSCSCAPNGSTSAANNITDILPAELRPQLTRAEPTDKALLYMGSPSFHHKILKTRRANALLVFNAPGGSRTHGRQGLGNLRSILLSYRRIRFMCAETAR